MHYAPSEPSALSEREASPKDCVMAFGVPTNEEEFSASIDAENREYTRQYFGGWPQYERYFVSRVQHVAPLYEALGVRVVYGLRRTDLPALFKNASVVTLFTHWAASGVELFDGIVSLPEIVMSVPEQFSGTFDLCVCHPDELVDLLLRDRPLCSVKYMSTRKAQPEFWLTLYEALYEILSLGQGWTYSSALNELFIKLRRSDEGKS